MKQCPICNLALNSQRHLKTHLEIKHRELKYLTVELDGDQFKMKIRQSYPDGEWDFIGKFWRAHDDQRFIALGRGIYAGEVDEERLSTDIAKVLDLGKWVM